MNITVGNKVKIKGSDKIWIVEDANFLGIAVLVRDEKSEDYHHNVTMVSRDQILEETSYETD